MVGGLLADDARWSDDSSRYSKSIWIACCLLIVTGVGSPATAGGDEANRQRAFQQDLVPLLRTYCFDCHGETDGEGDVNLAAFSSPDAILRDRKLWMRALGQIRLGSMPPADGETLDPATRKRMVDLIDDMANAVDCVQNPNAGKVVMRRLNRAEYRNTIRELLDVDYPAADQFPGDDVGYGFDNIGDVLSLPPLLMEKYLIAADKIAETAIVTPPPAEIFEQNRAGAQLELSGGAAARGGAATMFSRGNASWEIDFPFAGSFTVVVSARGDLAGDEPPRLDVSLGDKPLETISVTTNETNDFEFRFRSGPGKRKLDFAFTNDYYDKASKADRNVYIEHVNLIGQSNRRNYLKNSELTDRHRRLVFLVPDDSVSVQKASQEVLERLASRAYRRPATRREVDRLCALAAEVRDGGGTYEEGIQVALQAILISPHFLFKVERRQPTAADGQSLALTDFELATRLSYLLWSSMPDDALLKSAWAGNLSKPNVLRAHVARMIKDRRSNAFVENFAGQWLQLRNLDTLRPDSTMFPDATPAVRELMKRETLTFFAGVMRENMPVTTLLDAQFTYLNEQLASFYGISGVEGDHFRPVSLRGTERGGLLTQASVLTVTSNPTRTSPVKRGKWILENLLNTPPPPPPPNIPELDRRALSGTLRQRMEQHRSDPACAACHNMMDPLGFALENFDAVGRWRTSDGRDPIDARGEFPDGTRFEGVADLRSLLSEQRKDAFVRCLAEKMMIYALGRGLEYYDRCAVDEIVAQLESNEYRFAYLIAGIVESRPFQSQGTR
jgi:hypothetical protein